MYRGEGKGEYRGRTWGKMGLGRRFFFDGITGFRRIFSPSVSSVSLWLIGGLDGEYGC